jgi:hypothetical protein
MAVNTQAGGEVVLFFGVVVVVGEGGPRLPHPVGCVSEEAKVVQVQEQLSKPRILSRLL